MTEPNTQYNIPSALPIASPPTYLILIDSRVTNYQDIINAKQQGVHHIVFDVPAHGTYAKILFKSIEDKIAELGVSAFTSIGLVQHNDMRPNYEMFGPLANHIKPIVTSVSSADPYLQSWNSISIFITMLRLKYGIQYFDMMACAIYSNPDWKYIIDQLTVKTGVTIRASTDDTGSAALGGDWFLESHTGVNLKEYYFTAAIDSYNGILVTDGNNAGPSISTTKKLLLIDHLIPDISVIINSINDDTYCLVFNSSNDTYDTILSKLRFLTGSTRYILDNFYYAEPGSASDTAPVLSPSILQTENNWPFYPESTAISIQKPVFFQREKAGETMTTIPYGSTTNEPTTIVSRYIPRDKVRITDLDEIYEFARSAGEVPSSDAERIHFDCVGILQHAPLTNIGYKLTNMIPGQPAIIQNSQTLDANLSSWASVGSFIATLKSAYHMTTLDLMACALYSNEDWKYIIDNLAIQQNITIRASIDNTGSSYDGGNWILETQDINLITVYFTDEIYKWSYILPSSVTALRFDGVDDAVNVGVPAWTYSTQFRTTMTVECWFKTTDTNNQKGLSNFVSRWITAGYANSSMFLLAMETTGTITFWITNASGTLGGTWTNGSTYKDAQWHHVAVTYNSSSGVASMYIDGSLINSSTTASFGLLANNTGTRLIFGSDDAGAFGAQSDRQFRGSLSDIRIWNVVRSATEISDNYRRRLIGTETGLVGYWKLNEGNGTGWGSYSTALDSTSTRAHGTLIAAAFGGSPSSSWVVSDISFNPRISTLTLGANNGVYNLSDSSFSFIDPSSNSLGDFTYAISSGAVATISNGSATMKTVYATSGATVTIPTLSLYEFPEIASLTSWQLDISFTVTGGSGSWRGVIGDMYNEINSGRGWGIWVSSSNRIHWSWNNATVEPDTITVNLNTAYVLTVAQSSGTITITLRTVSSGATQTGSFSVGSNITGKGPVTIGGWRSYGGEIFPGTISYVNVSVPTNQRVITLASSTGGTPATITATQSSFLDFAAGTKTASLTVNSNTITPTISSWTIADVSFGVSPFTLTPPTSDSSGGFRYQSSNTSVADVCGNTVTVKSAGQAIITATQDACGNYLSGTRTGTLTVRQIAPTINAWTIVDVSFGVAPFTLTPPTTDSSGGFGYQSSTTAVVDVCGNTVTVKTAGQAVITATQDACGNYLSGTRTATLTVNPIAPPIYSWTIADVSFGVSPFALTPPTSDSSGGFRYQSSNTSVADVCGNTVTVKGAGQTTITATQDACGNYLSGTRTATLTVNLPTPTFSTSFANVTKNYLDSSFALVSPVSNSIGEFSFSSNNAAVGTINPATTINALQFNGTTNFIDFGSNITELGKGSFTIELWIKTSGTSMGLLNCQDSDTLWEEGEKSLYIDSAGLPAFVGYGNDFIYSNRAVNDNTWHHIAVSWEYTSGTSGTRTIYIDGINRTNTSHPYPYIANKTNFGTFVFGKPTNSENVNYFNGAVCELRVWNIARSATDIFQNYRRMLVGNESGLVAYNRFNQGTASGTNTSITTVTNNKTSSGYTGTLSGNFALTGSSSNWVSGVYIRPTNDVNVIGAGTATITVTQAANGDYTSQTATATLTVNPIPPTISTWTIADVSFGVAPFTLTRPTSDSSGGFGYQSSTTSVADVCGNTVTVKGAGQTTITATQDACGNYLSGTRNGTLTVRQIAPPIYSWTIADVSFGVSPFTLTPPTSDSSGGFGYQSSNTSVADVCGNTVTVKTAGQAVITATQDACGNYLSGTRTGTLTVRQIAPNINTWTIDDVSFRVAPFTLTPPISDSSGGFGYQSSNTSVADVCGNTVTVKAAGQAVITATQDACGNYLSGTRTGTLTVRQIAPTINTWTIADVSFGVAPFTLTRPTSDSSGVFRYYTNTPRVATVTEVGVVTIVGAGYTIIFAIQDACGNFYAANNSTALVVLPIAPTLGPLSFPTSYFNDASFFLTRPTTDSGGSFDYSSDTPSVATISDTGRITIFRAGRTTISVTQYASGNFTIGTVTGVFEVLPIAPVISPSTIIKYYGDPSFNIRPTSTNSDVTGYNGDGLGGGLFSFSGSSNSSVITVFDTSYVGIAGIGSASITVYQTATRNFTSGSQTIMVTINKGSPVLSTLSVSSNKTYGSAPFSILTTPTSESNGVITYSSSDMNVATIDNSGVITLVASGYVTFIATQASTAFYNLATKASNTMTVYRRTLQLTRIDPSNAVINKIYGDSYFTVSASNESNGGAFTYETDNPSVAGIINASTGVISVVSVGSAIITARRAQTAQYTSYPIAWTVEVARAPTTLTGLTDLSYNVTTAPFTVSASSASNSAVTYSLQDPSSTVLTIHPTTGLVTLKSPGRAVIVASQVQSALYLAPANITATITVSSAGNALQGATLTNTSSFTSVDLSGASLAGVSITNTTFSDAKLSNANFTNAVITSANFTSANLSGATLSGATITGATFTSTSLKNADLSGATLTSTTFTGSDLSGANLTGIDASGASFANAKLNNVDMTGAKVQNVNFTNTSIKGANIVDVSFSPLQKLQLLRNSDNRDIGQIIIPAVSGTTILSAISETSPLRAIANLDLTSASVSVSVVVPTTSTSPTAVLPDVVLNVTNSDKFYLPINESEYFQIEGVKYSTLGGVVRNYETNAVVDVITYNGKSIWLLAGSIVGLVLQTNTLNTSSFVVPAMTVFKDTAASFMPTTLPTTNSESAIIYSSNNPFVATIDASSGLITMTGNTGFVKFTATQVQNSTYEPGRISSNYMSVDKNVNLTLVGLNQSFNLSTLALLDASAVNMDATDATSIYYVRLSDINNVFKYQTDSFDVNDITSSDIKYYVFHRKWPAELKINPSHSMMDKAESLNMLGNGEGYVSNKSLLKHDFIRYISLRLFNTIHGVDLFRNESDLQENAVYFGETVRYNIDNILSGISTTSNSGTMAIDSSGNKYLTNDSSGNTNLCRELMRQIAASASSRFYNNDGTDKTLKNVPFLENDTIVFKLIIQSAVSQNSLTGVGLIPSRSYTIKLVIKNTVTTVTNANTAVVDSEMYPNSYPYSSSVMTYAPTSASSAVYNIYSPPAPIPFSRFGYNGWYYTNSTTWVNVAPTVRNHIKWLVPANTGASTVANLKYIRINLKIHNNASLPYLMIYTEAGSSRKYSVNGGNGSLANGNLYSLYMNFNSYLDEPAMIGYSNAALAYSVGSGTFSNNEVITSIAIETESNATASNVEFTLSSMIVGEQSTSGEIKSEKEYGFEADVPVTYP